MTTAMKIYQFFVQNNWFTSVRQLLTTNSTHSTDLRFTWKRNYQGSLYLEVYDPTTAKRHYFESEQEARIWVEKRHHI